MRKLLTVEEIIRRKMEKTLNQIRELH